MSSNYISSKTSFTILFICSFLSISLAQNNESNNASDFSYLKYQNSEILSTHAIKYTLKIPNNFKAIKPLNHKPSFNNHTFNVSVAALMNEENLIVVHAEKVTDGSGFLDYSYMEPVELKGMKFFTQENCLELTEDQIKSTADVNYINENGFDFGNAIYSKQFFVNTSDGIYEYVLTFIERVCDCTDKSVNDNFIEKFNQKLERLIKISKSE